MSTKCTKAFTLKINSGCELATCSTKSACNLPSGEHVADLGIAWDSEHCYCLVMHYDHGYTITRFSKYDPATNTLVLKDTYAGYVQGLVYDENVKLFAAFNTNVIVTFNPVTELSAVHVPASPTNFAPSAQVYVPQKLKSYMHLGTDGTNYYVGYADLTAFDYVYLGTIPPVGATHPFGYNLAYSPVSDSLYGPWIAVATGTLKFNLATNVGTAQAIPASVTGQSALWDSDRSLMLIMNSSTVSEVDTLTDTVSNTYTSVIADMDYRRMWYYCSSLKKVFGSGYNAAGDWVLISYDTQTHLFAYVLQDYQYRQVVGISGASAMNYIEDLTNDPEGVRRLCLT